MARLGVGLLVVPQKPWEQTVTELDAYGEMFRELNGHEPPLPIVACQIYCDEDGDRAETLGERYICNYYASVLKHYELGGDHFAETKGYEYYKNIAASIQEHGDEEAKHYYTNLHVYGTPDECVDKIADIRDKVGCDHFIGVFRYGGIEYDDALRNLRLFKDKVQPRVKAM